MGDNLESFGGSSGELEEKAMAAIASLVAELQPGAMVTRFVLIFETIDDEDRWISSATDPGQKEWDTLGLLQWGLSTQQASMGPVQRWEPGEDDDDSVG